MVGAGASGKSTQDWHEVWKNSQESKDVQTELARIKNDMSQQQSKASEGKHSEFAMPFTAQLKEVTVRVFREHHHDQHESIRLTIT